MARELVLIVDDDVDLAAVLSELLEARNLETRVAASSAEGLRLFGEETPILCILDWFLPDGPPVALANECRSRGVPIVLSSAADESKAWAEQIGADGVLEKPFDVDSFYRIIEEVRGSASLVT